MRKGTCCWARQLWWRWILATIGRARGRASRPKLPMLHSAKKTWCSECRSFKKGDENFDSTMNPCQHDLAIWYPPRVGYIEVARIWHSVARWVADKRLYEHNPGHYMCCQGSQAMKVGRGTGHYRINQHALHTSLHPYHTSQYVCTTVTSLLS